ncbi:MAG: hypothetical protein AAF688_07330 [Bacteroidota bacterium]
MIILNTNFLVILIYFLAIGNSNAQFEPKTNTVYNGESRFDSKILEPCLTANINFEPWLVADALKEYFGNYTATKILLGSDMSFVWKGIQLKNYQKGQVNIYLTYGREAKSFRDDNGEIYRVENDHPLFIRGLYMLDLFITNDKGQQLLKLESIYKRVSRQLQRAIDRTEKELSKREIVFDYIRNDMLNLPNKYSKVLTVSSPIANFEIVDALHKKFGDFIYKDNIGYDHHSFVWSDLENKTWLKDSFNLTLTIDDKNRLGRALGGMDAAVYIDGKSTPTGPNMVFIYLEDSDGNVAVLNDRQIDIITDHLYDIFKGI